MEPITAAALQALMQGLGERCSQPATLYLLGGSALCFMGSPRQTLGLDYMAETSTEAGHEFQKALVDLAAALQLDIDPREFRAYFAEIRHRVNGRGAPG